jgi:hypothetical protein
VGKFMHVQYVLGDVEEGDFCVIVQKLIIYCTAIVAVLTIGI